MASVQDIKDALETEQQRSVELADKAFQAIDTVTNLANFWLTALSIGIAIVGLIGLGAVYLSSKREARRVAEARIKSYLEGEEVQSQIGSLIETEVQRRIERGTFVMVHPEPPKDGAAFPDDPKARSGKGK